jgi:hypothetical protein
MAEEDVLARLEREIARLRQEVEALRARGPGSSMRVSQQCPGCGGKKLLHVRNVQELTDNSSLVPMALLHSKHWYGSKAQSGLEAFVCRGCSLVEWYATGLDAFERTPKLAEDVSAIDGTPPGDGGPYR